MPGDRGYRIEVAAAAARQFRKLEPAVQLRLSRKIDSLSSDPRPQGVTKLQGKDNLYRIRDGDFRIIYAIEDRKLLILVLSVGNRRDIYRR